MGFSIACGTLLVIYRARASTSTTDKQLIRYLWREDDTLKTIHDLKWYGFLPGELLFLTNEFIVFLVLGEDGYPVVVQVCPIPPHLSFPSSTYSIAHYTSTPFWIWILRSSETLELYAVVLSSTTRPVPQYRCSARLVFLHIDIPSRTIFAELKPLELCKTLGAQAVFAGLLDEQATLGVVVSTGRERETLVTTFQVFMICCFRMF
jgi:hypothetical protein